MAKKKVQEMAVFSQNDIQQYENVCSVIADCQSKAEGLAERIAGQLYICSRKELFKIDGFTSMGEWATSKFEISPGTCSDAINTYSRFGSKDVIGEIDDKYKEFMFSTLIAMKKLSDEDIEVLGITPTMSRSQVKKAIESRQALEDQKAKRNEMYNNVMKRFDLCEQATKGKQFDTLGADPMTVTRYTITASIFEFLPNFLHEGETAPTTEQLETVYEYLGELYNHINSGLIYVQPASNGDYVFRFLEEDKPEEVQQEQEQSEEVQQEQEQPEEVQQEQEQEQPEEVQQEIPTCPLLYIRIKNYIREDGSIDKKRFLADVWEATQGVINHTEEVLVTFEE